MSKFEVHFPIQAKNIDNCKQLDIKIKEKFFEEIKGIAPETDEALEKQAVKNKANEYFHNNQFTGQQLTLKESERLGCLQSWSGFINFTATLPPSYKDIFDKDKLEQTMLSVNNGELSALEDILGPLREASIPFPFLTWCFRTDTLVPFKGIHLDSLPCRLGLDDLDIQQYFPIEITPPHNIVVKTPTAFDAGLNEHWRPGGKTCHRANCTCQQKDGMDEVVIKDGLTYGHVKAPKI